MSEDAERVRLAAVSLSLDWSHRQLTSGEKFDADVARRYVDAHVAFALGMMDQAAAMGARLVLGPEYFRGSEMFTTDPEQKRTLAEDAQGETVGRMRELSGRRGVYLAAAMEMWHGDVLVQTGVVTGPRGELVGVQPKNTALPEGSPLARGYELLELDFARAGVFTCSDLTTFPEDTIPLAKAGMNLVLVPGCGFAGVHWKSFLTVRATDLACAVVYADGGRAAIVDKKARVRAERHVPDAIAAADVDLEPKAPAERLRSSL